MQLRVLGTAAGGGVPQWNCACPGTAGTAGVTTDVYPEADVHADVVELVGRLRREGWLR